MSVLSENPTVSPTVSRIVTVLKERVQSGLYKEGEWLPTERDLAQDFRVSRILIRAAVKELERYGYLLCTPHRRPMVKSLSVVRQAKTVVRRNMAISIWPHPSWPPSGMIIQGMQEALGSEFRLILGSPASGNLQEAEASEARFLTQIHHDQDVEGIILSYMGGSRNLPQLELLRAANIPLIFLDHLPPRGFEADYVGVDNRQGAEQAVKYLLSLGHRRIAHVSNYDSLSTVAERLAGYRRALESAHIAFDPELVQRDPGPPGDNPEVGCEELVARLIEQPNPPTAIFAVHDVIALRVIAALRGRGLRVPEDMSVIGFDGIERWMPTNPFLTTLYQPLERLGARAVELLRARIQQGPTTTYKHTILDVSLAVHRSTRAL